MQSVISTSDLYLWYIVLLAKPTSGGKYYAVYTTLYLDMTVLWLTGHSQGSLSGHFPLFHSFTIPNPNPEIPTLNPKASALLGLTTAVVGGESELRMNGRGTPTTAAGNNVRREEKWVEGRGRFLSSNKSSPLSLLKKNSSHSLKWSNFSVM